MDGKPDNQIGLALLMAVQVEEGCRLSLNHTLGRQ
jgi:hypothetical protein